MMFFGQTLNFGNFLWAHILHFYCWKFQFGILHVSIQNKSMIQLVKYIMKSKINILVNCFILPWGPLFRLLIGVAYT